VIFFERNVPYYAAHRDFEEMPSGELILYSEWKDVAARAKRHLNDADIGMVTSYCPDAVIASALLLEAPAPVRAFYDLDSPVTLSRLRAGLPVDYLGPRGLRDFDLVLSYTGGDAIRQLQSQLGARRVEVLYGSVDPAVHTPVRVNDRYKGHLSYLGTHSPDRDAALQTLFVEPARRLPEHRFILGGSQYGAAFPWNRNIYFLGHVPSADHPAFYCSSMLTLNVTRQPMAELGYCPSGRLFEATACGAAVLSDVWPGLDRFFEPGAEILVAGSSEEAMQALNRSPEELAKIARAGRERTLAVHTSHARAEQFEEIINRSFRPAAEIA
jgi:spore maturation protein CgeB